MKIRGRKLSSAKDRAKDRARSYRQVRACNLVALVESVRTPPLIVEQQRERTTRLRTIIPLDIAKERLLASLRARGKLAED